MSKRLLIIDDEVDICDYISTVAQDLGFEISVGKRRKDFEPLYIEFQPSLIILDLSLPDGDGIELLRFLGDHSSASKIILMSGVDKRVLITAEQLGIDHGLDMLGVLTKPIMVDELEEILSRADDGEQAIDAEELKAAFQHDQFFMMFQPKAHKDAEGDWQIKGSEALIRWNHPASGILGPGQFIPLIETAMLLEQMTHLAFLKSLDQVVAWRKEGLEMSVSVNVPPQLLADLELPDAFLNAAVEREIDPSSVTLEITETGVMDDVGAAMDILARFRLKEFKLSLDDYGTGFSSLKQLYRMPFSELKIDQSFVQDVTTSKEAAVIVRTSAEMAANLDLEVCMEGVEEQDQLEFILSVPCNSIQGYLISRPIMGEDMAAFVKDWDSRAASIMQKKTGDAVDD